MNVLRINEKATREQMVSMLSSLQDYVKLAVDVEMGVLAGGGELHADCETVLLDHASKQENVWGADWIPSLGAVTFESLINIRPGQQNFSMIIADADLKKRIEQIVRNLLEDVEYE